MSRPKGALNRRTRAALDAVKTGELDANGISTPVKFLLSIVENCRKPDGLRIEAARAVAPYLQPKLNSVEIATPDAFEGESRDDIVARLRLLLADPSIARELGVPLPSPSVVPRGG